MGQGLNCYDRAPQPRYWGALSSGRWSRAPQLDDDYHHVMTILVKLIDIALDPFGKRFETVEKRMVCAWVA